MIDAILLPDLEPQIEYFIIIIIIIIIKDIKGQKVSRFPACPGVWTKMIKWKVGNGNGNGNGDTRRGAPRLVWTFLDFRKLGEDR